GPTARHEVLQIRNTFDVPFVEAGPVEDGIGGTLLHTSQTLFTIVWPGGHYLPFRAVTRGKHISRTNEYALHAINAEIRIDHGIEEAPVIPLGQPMFNGRLVQRCTAALVEGNQYPHGNDNRAPTQKIPRRPALPNTVRDLAKKKNGRLQAKPPPTSLLRK